MTKVWSEARAALRQWRQPPEFRIPASQWPADALTALAELTKAELTKAELTKAELTKAELTAEVTEPTDSHPMAGRSVADVATSLWRMRGRIERMDDPPRVLVRHVEKAWDALTDAGVEIRDHTGEPFDTGLAMSVVAYQPTPGLRREQIIETVTPGIYLGERSIQMAEVIVGMPEREQGQARHDQEHDRLRD